MFKLSWRGGVLFILDLPKTCNEAYCVMMKLGFFRNLHMWESNHLQPYIQVIFLKKSIMTKAPFRTLGKKIKRKKINERNFKRK